MQRISESQVLYSPSDLVHFLSCNHCTVLDLKNLTEKMQKAQESTTNKLLQAKGFEHEAKYLNQLKSKGKAIKEIPKDSKSLAERAELTKQAMQSGVDVVYQAVLTNGNWRGDADFLIKVDKPSKLGNFSYEVLDTKLARHSDPKHIIQLCLYTDLLEATQDVRAEHMYLYLGDETLVAHEVNDYFFYYRHAKQRFEGFATNPPADSTPEPCQYCTFCSWKDLCESQWQKDDHLSLVANIQRSQIDKLRTASISTVAALANLPPNAKVPDLNGEVLERLRSQAALQIHKRTQNEDKCEILPFPLEKGMHRLPMPNAGDLFFDMEGDPLHPGGLEYLFGIYFASKGEHTFVPFWAHNHNEESIAFRHFMKFLEDHLAEFPNAHIYHYNHYETSALKRLACRYAIAEEQLDNLLRQHKFVDLYKVVRESLRISESSYSLKNLETFYMEKREGAVATAGDSIVAYHQWRESQNEEILKQIASYNEMDCISTYKLREWLLTKRPEHVAWFTATNLQGEAPSTERKDWEIEYEKYQQALVNNAPAGQMDVRTRMAHLLEFHRREAKPQWWASFERCDKTEDEIIDDVACLGGLVLSGRPVPEKKSLIYAYQFPPQEYKLKVGDAPVEVIKMQRAGTIVDLDEDSCIVKLKRGTQSGNLPHTLNLGPSGPISTDQIRAAIYRVADSIIAGSGKYRCVTELLNRSLPKIAGKQRCEPIIGNGELIKESVQAVSALDSSYLFIQGPPGAGKTYTSAHIIVGLLQQGKKVGVAANSHKAIHNLLTMIETVAEEKVLNFQGIKKSSAGNEESAYESRNIRSVANTKDIGQFQLLAGTAWLFADPSLDERLDYLFIDEAGQVSVANVVAMGTATKNIVLVGDQMQLGQPIQGVHPGEAGLSVLEFLLGDLATIPPDRGIFLDKTRRLATSICQFVSDAFYESRLAAHEENARRKLTLDLQDIPNEGILLIPAEHTGCSQKSSEEAQIIKERYQQLLGKKFQDKDGKVRKLTEDDILVVTPYNVQVNHLKSVLPTGARVGTVDKFQGQEAPVVLISMVTSSAEDLPRNIEFLYSKNRLNVALSRAQCLAVVVMNPKLLEIPCRTTDQMKLVNTFCWLDAYAAG